MARKELENLGFTVKDDGKIDFNNPPEGKMFVPIPTSEEEIKLRKIDRRFVTMHRFSATTTLAVMELIDEEEAEKAKAYTAEIKCEYKREERKRRCKIISTITGQVRLCPDCISCYGDECPKKHGMVVEEGGPAPFEELAEFVKSSVYTDDPTADEAVVNVMWDSFKRNLRTEDESFVKLIELNEQGFVAKEIMERLGKSKTWYYDSWKEIHKRWINYNKD